MSWWLPGLSGKWKFFFSLPLSLRRRCCCLPLLSFFPSFFRSFFFIVCWVLTLARRPVDAERVVVIHHVHVSFFSCRFLLLFTLYVDIRMQFSLCDSEEERGREEASRRTRSLCHSFNHSGRWEHWQIHVFLFVLCSRSRHAIVY